jgi:hypothetical protein
MEIIKGFYRNVSGKYPEKTGLPDIEPSKVRLVCHDELVDGKVFLLLQPEILKMIL